MSNHKLNKVRLGGGDTLKKVSPENMSAAELPGWRFRSRQRKKVDETVRNKVKLGLRRCNVAFI